jgi:hypothetical protein
MTDSGTHPRSDAGTRSVRREAASRRLALATAVLLHAFLLLAAVLTRLPDPPLDQQSLELRFLGLPKEEGERKMSETIRRTAAPGRRPAAARPVVAPLAGVDERTGPEQIHIVMPVVDSAVASPVVTLRSVLDREMSAEQAWEMLGQLLEQYPQFREMVVREMIAGSGLPPDSLPRINLHLDQIFKDGIPLTWQTQRGAIESASRSFDPVMGWTNKGGYGPSINVFGLVKFLMDLIEGKK